MRNAAGGVEHGGVATLNYDFELVLQRRAMPGGCAEARGSAVGVLHHWRRAGRTLLGVPLSSGGRRFLFPLRKPRPSRGEAGRDEPYFPRLRLGLVGGANPPPHSVRETRVAHPLPARLAAERRREPRLETIWGVCGKPRSVRPRLPETV
jgi:hypothetical protein